MDVTDAVLLSLVPFLIILAIAVRRGALGPGPPSIGAAICTRTGHAARSSRPLACRRDLGQREERPPPGVRLGTLRARRHGGASSARGSRSHLNIPSTCPAGAAVARYNAHRRGCRHRPSTTRKCGHHLAEHECHGAVDVASRVPPPPTSARTRRQRLAWLLPVPRKVDRVERRTVDFRCLGRPLSAPAAPEKGR